MNLSSLLHSAILASLKAGKHIAAVYENGFEVEYKSDASPVTIADKQANQIIEEYLSIHNIPMLGEEGIQHDYDERKHWDKLWIVDPLDGTKEFVKRNGEFTVNIALSVKGVPVIGVIFSPVFKDLYFASDDLGSYKMDRHTYIELEDKIKNLSLAQIIASSKKLPLQQLLKVYTVVASRSHQNGEIRKYIQALKNSKGEIDTIYTGSSIKMCWIAEGKAHEYPRYGRTMEWDTCAGHCILKNAGGAIVEMETKENLRYNKLDIANPNFLAYRAE